MNNPDLQNFLLKNLDPQFRPENVTWSFDALCWVAFYYNPTLDRTRAAWRSAQETAKSTHARLNPSLTITPGFSANSPMGVSPWIPIISADFPIETAGKRAHREKAAQLEAETARQSVFSAAWRLRSELRQALYDLALAQTRLENLRLQAATSTKILDSFEARQRAGVISANEVAPAKLAAVRLRSLLASAESQPSSARIKVANVLGVPVSALENLQFSPVQIPADVSAAQLKALRDRALTSRPDILGALARYENAQAALALEISKQYPDLHLGPAYQYDQGQNKWSLGLTAELPIFNHNQAGIATASARREEMAAEFLETQSQAIAEIESAAAQWDAAKLQLSSLEKLFAELSRERSSIERRRAAGVIDHSEQENAQLDLAIAGGARQEAELQFTFAGGNLEDALQIPLPNFDAVTLSPLRDSHEQ